MAFRFKKSESAAKALRRVGRERVGVALDCLRRPGRRAVVHGARREIKKLRALFRLVRGEMGARDYRKGMKALRAAADSLAAARDARVRLRVFKRIAGERTGEFARIHRALVRAARREARRFRKDNAVARARRWLRKTARRMDAVAVQRPGWAAVGSGFRRCYERGREAWQSARERPLPERFHGWRRHVKELGFYFRLLRPARASLSDAALEDLDRLGEELGLEHDLFLLRRFVAPAERAPAREAKKLNRLIAARRKQLQAGALQRGGRLFAESAADFCGRVLPGQ